MLTDWKQGGCADTVSLTINWRWITSLGVSFQTQSAFASCDFIVPCCHWFSRPLLGAPQCRLVKPCLLQTLSLMLMWMSVRCSYLMEKLIVR